LAASIYNARAGLKPLVIAGSPPGGQLILTSEVENYPGFESIMGQELIDKMRKHALKFGVRFIDENVIKVDFSKRPFKIYLPNNEARHRVFSSTSPPKGGSPKSLTKKQVSSLLPMNQKISLGNIMARVRMIILFDLAKKHNALVCGTENKSERLLGYFTRFGDAASDIEPVTHLYKTQIYQLAKYLKVTKKIIDQPPTADLWKGQTDEGEFGFTYEEADQVLYLYFDKKIATKEIKRLGFKNVEKIIKRFLGNQFKQETPYSLFTLRYLAAGRQGFLVPLSGTRNDRWGLRK